MQTVGANLGTAAAPACPFMRDHAAGRSSEIHSDVPSSTWGHAQINSGPPHTKHSSQQRTANISSKLLRATARPRKPGRRTSRSWQRQGDAASHDATSIQHKHLVRRAQSRMSTVKTPLCTVMHTHSALLLVTQPGRQQHKHTCTYSCAGHSFPALQLSAFCPASTRARLLYACVRRQSSSPFKSPCVVLWTPPCVPPP